jgi:hypothetical protein
MTENPQPSLLPCPFCHGQMHIKSNSDWHRLYGVHGADCVFEDDTSILMFGATDEGLQSIHEIWNTRADLTPRPTPAMQTDEVGEYQAGTWFKCKTIDEMSAFYLSRLPAIREAAHSCGYAIGMHGSTRRDFDLMAMPWIDTATDKDTLAIAIQHAACGISYEKIPPEMWEQKPHGRWAVSLPICWTEWTEMASAGHIDLSVITAATEGRKPVEVTVEQLGDAIEEAMFERGQMINRNVRPPIHAADHYARYIAKKFPQIIVPPTEIVNGEG